MPSGAVELEHDDAIALALVSRTTASSSFAKKGLLTRFERNQTVSPLAGATKAGKADLVALTRMLAR